MSDRFDPPNPLEIGAGGRARPVCVLLWIFGTALLVQTGRPMILFFDDLVGPGLAYLLSMAIFLTLVVIFEVRSVFRRLPSPTRQRGWAQDRAYGELAMLAAMEAVKGTPQANNRIFLPVHIQKWGAMLIALGYAMISNFGDGLPPQHVVLLLPVLRLWYLWHCAVLYRSMLPGAHWILLAAGGHRVDYEYVSEDWVARAGLAFELLNPPAAAHVARPLDPVDRGELRA